MDKKGRLALVLIQWVMGFIWLQSGWGKLIKPDFIGNIEKMLTGFAAKTPYGFYADFLNSTVIPNAVSYGNLTRIAEALTGLALFLGGYLVLKGVKPRTLPMWAMVFALLVGAFLNLNFYLAAGASSPSTGGLNMLMGASQLILAIYYLTASSKSSAS